MVEEYGWGGKSGMFEWNELEGEDGGEVRERGEGGMEEWET